MALIVILLGISNDKESPSLVTLDKEHQVNIIKKQRDKYKMQDILWHGFLRSQCHGERDDKEINQDQQRIKGQKM